MADNTNNQINLSGASIEDNILMEEEAILGSSTSTGSQGSKQSATKFHIPALVKQRYPKLIPLILKTESMDDEEREYWFQILPIMTNEQVEQFKKILLTEKDQLAKLDAEYEAELDKINDNHINQWQAFESKQQREALEKREEAHETYEKQTEADLLAKLQNL